MVVLVSVGFLFGLILVAFVVLLLIRRSKRHELEKDSTGYLTEEKSSCTTITGNASGGTRIFMNMNTMDSSTLSSSLKDKSLLSQFVDLTNSSSSPIVNYENSSEMSGTYRSRLADNSAYDNSDDSLKRSTTATIRSPANNNNNNKTKRVDFDDYWRTNV